MTALTEEGGIVLDRTVFYPTGGGQPGDSGTLIWDGGHALQIATAIKGPGDGVVLVPYQLAVLAPGTNGFARGVLRGLARERRRSDIGMEPPFRLARWSDGRLTLEDPTTGRRIELGAFGPTNAEVFAALMLAPAASGT